MPFINRLYQRPPHRDALRAALLTGVRIDDVRTTRWEDVDLAHGDVHIPDPKGGAERAFDLPISKRLHDLLQERRKEHERAVREKFLPEHAAPWVFGAWSESGHIKETREPARSDKPFIECLRRQDCRRYRRARVQVPRTTIM